MTSLLERKLNLVSVIPIYIYSFAREFSFTLRGFQVLGTLTVGGKKSQI
jgi:hypothetical protein